MEIFFQHFVFDIFILLRRNSLNEKVTGPFKRIEFKNKLMNPNLVKFFKHLRSTIKVFI